MRWPFIHKTPERLQIEPIECGAVALGIILEWFGRHVTNAELRLLAKVSRHGSDATSIMEAAEKLGLNAKAKRLLSSDIKTLTSPAILFVDRCHFLVFEGYFLGRYYLNDPARGRYFLDERAFRKRFSNVAIEFSKTARFIRNRTIAIDQKKTRGPNRSLPMALGVCSAIIVALLGSLSGYLFTGTDASHGIHHWGMIFALIILISLGGFAIWIFKELVFSVAISRSDAEIDHLKHSLFNVPSSFFDDVNFSVFSFTFKSALDRAFKRTYHEANHYFSITFFSVLLLVIAAISLSVFLLVMLIVIVFGIQTLLKEYFISHQGPSLSFMGAEQSVALNKALMQAEAMRGMGQDEIFAHEVLKKSMEDVRQEKLASLTAISGLTSLILPLALYIMGFCAVIAESRRQGDLLPAEIFCLTILSFYIFLALHKMFVHHPVAVLEQASLATELAYAQKKSIEEITANNRELLALKDVSFTYRGGLSAILLHINLTIRRKELVGVVSAPQVGTSTLLRLIGKQLNPSSGTIIHFVKNKSLRVVLVDDDSEVFEGSLKDNVTLLNTKFSEPDIVLALKNACALDLFYNRSMGLLTPIFPHGINLSAGEKRRLLLAQALLHQPDILILDQFFDQLEYEITNKILANLSSMNISVVLSSYRSNELKECDRIMFIKDQKTLLVDTHEHLLATEPIYRNLVIDPHVEDSLV